MDFCYLVGRKGAKGGELFLEVKQSVQGHGGAVTITIANVFQVMLVSYLLMNQEISDYMC